MDVHDPQYTYIYARFQRIGSLIFVAGHLSFYKSLSIPSGYEPATNFTTRGTSNQTTNTPWVLISTNGTITYENIGGSSDYSFSAMYVPAT